MFIAFWTRNMLILVQINTQCLHISALTPETPKFLGYQEASKPKVVQVGQTAMMHVCIAKQSFSKKLRVCSAFLNDFTYIHKILKLALDSEKLCDLFCTEEQTQKASVKCWHYS